GPRGGSGGGAGAGRAPPGPAPPPPPAAPPAPDARPGRDDGRGGVRPGGGSARWRLRRRRERVETRPGDELIEQILTGADPTRRRGARAGTPAGSAARAGGDATSAGTTAEVPPPAHAATATETAPAARAAHATEAVVTSGGTPTGPATTDRPAVREADDPGEITMYYQPQIAIATGEVVGVEALLRWRHPRRGMVDPGELIQVAEQSAVMRLLTRRVVDDVVEQLAKWSAAGLTLRAALNVSVRDLHTGEIADQIADRLARYGVPPERLQVEITEGALMADPRRVLASITQLHRIGVGIALDDFGTGYSSLQHLRRLPLSEVKVDRSFVLGMADDPDDAAIVRSMIELAGALGLRVVAEGVEDERTWRLLHAAGCDVAQGWFHARPMPAEELAAWLSRYRPVRPAVAEAGGRGGPEGESKASS
ncbi:EAL domain-containing protein, partial [Micromonospora sediminicola]|uniref:putative bifunctional diguanylate cyclase/phosphodiesterase n=1 Tax=Micromonospora sediminicola TaxID=946078 RepID=UPI0033B7E369